MNDILKVLKQAKESYPCIERQEFHELMEDICKKDESLSLDWDYGAGEEWARFYSLSQGAVCMISTELPIAFIRSSYDYTYIGACLHDIEIVCVESYSEDDWSVDLDKLAIEIPEIHWHASLGAVDPACFCLDDFYFATV